MAKRSQLKFDNTTREWREQARRHRNVVKHQNELVNQTIQLMLALHWKLADFVEYTELSRSTFYNYRKARTRYPRLETIQRLARAMGADLVFIDRPHRSNKSVHNA